MTPKQWLTTMARAVASYLDETREGTGITLYPNRKIRASDSNTNGWSATLGRLRIAGGGSLMLFYDPFPHLGRRMLSACYNTVSREQAVRLSRTPTRSFGNPLCIGDAEVLTKPHIRLKLPLAKKHHDRPLLELYPDRSDFFLSVYFADTVRTARLPRHLVHKAAEFFVDVARGAAAKPSLPREDGPYSALNRTIVRQHLVRERSSKLATQAKVRDGYTCQICEFNFGMSYGELGSAFAEAHHVIPLASPKARKATVVGDLITVCSNCHRMLHLLAGEPGDISRLRRIVTKHRSGQTRPRKG